MQRYLRKQLGFLASGATIGLNCFKHLRFSRCTGVNYVHYHVWLVKCFLIAHIFLDFCESTLLFFFCFVLFCTSAETELSSTAPWRGLQWNMQSLRNLFEWPLRQLIRDELTVLNGFSRGSGLVLNHCQGPDWAPKKFLLSQHQNANGGQLWPAEGQPSGDFNGAVFYWNKYCGRRKKKKKIKFRIFWRQKCWLQGESGLIQWLSVIH